MNLEYIVTAVLIVGGVLYAAYIGHGVPPANPFTKACLDVANGHLPDELSIVPAYDHTKLAIIRELEPEAARWMQWYVRARMFCFAKGVIVAAVGVWRLIHQLGLGGSTGALDLEVVGLGVVGLLALMDYRQTRAYAERTNVQTKLLAERIQRESCA